LWVASGMNAKQLTMRDFEKSLSDLLREWRRTSPWLLEAMIEGLMEDKGCSRDEAIRELAEWETTLKQMLEASQRIGEA
jgi:hypothetical protein